jgi:D-alanine-D-alanine ligase
VEPAIAHRVGDIALACWRLFGLDGYARVDFRVDEHGDPWVLEVNANPCLSPDAGFAAALAEAGIEYRAAVAGLVDDALRRHELE